MTAFPRETRIPGNGNWIKTKLFPSNGIRILDIVILGLGIHERYGP